MTTTCRILAGVAAWLALAATGLSGSVWAQTAPTEGGDPALGSWTPLPGMERHSTNYSVVRLDDGRVLVTGGQGMGRTAVEFADVFDVEVGAWAAVEPMPSARRLHTSTLLGDGRVLLLGGLNENGDVLDSALIYDPGAARWSVLIPMSQPRVDHTATLLSDGSVLVVGGSRTATLGAESTLLACELYTPATGTWSAAAPLPASRALHVAPLLPDGRVLVAGGIGSDAPQVSSPEFLPQMAWLLTTLVYDPAADTWSPSGRLSTRFSDPLVAVLPDGRMLMTGIARDRADYRLALVEDRDPVSGEWTRLTEPEPGWVPQAWAMLPDGRLFGVGLVGYSQPWAGIVDPADGEGTPVASPPNAGAIAVLVIGHDSLLLAAVNGGSALYRW